MTFIIALVFSAIGFKKYVWFISIGYGLSVAAIGIFLPLYFGAEDGMLPVIASILLILYGCRLSGYLIFREVKKQIIFGSRNNLDFPAHVHDDIELVAVREFLEVDHERIVNGCLHPVDAVHRVVWSILTGAADTHRVCEQTARYGHIAAEVIA